MLFVSLSKGTADTVLFGNEARGMHRYRTCTCISKSERGLCPRCQAAGSMEAVRLYSLEETRIGMYGIRTVSDKRPPLATEALDLIMVPALAFDVKGHRLGHGGGYYDRFLARSGQALCIGVAWDCQVVAQVPIEPWDRGVSAILTPTRFLKITI